MSLTLDYGVKKYVPWWEDNSKFIVHTHKEDLVTVMDWEDILQDFDRKHDSIKRKIRRALRKPMPSTPTSLKSALEVIDEQLTIISNAEYVSVKAIPVSEYVMDLLQIREYTIHFANDNITFMPEPRVKDRYPLKRNAPIADVQSLRDVLMTARAQLHKDAVPFYLHTGGWDAYQQYLLYRVQSSKGSPSVITRRHIFAVKMVFPFIEETNTLYVPYRDWDYDSRVHKAIDEYIDEFSPHVTVVCLYYPGAVLRDGVLRTHTHDFPSVFIAKLPDVTVRRVKDSWKYV